MLTIPTCLDPRALHEDSKVQESRLETQKNCLQGVVHRYASELKQLEDRGLFAGEVKDYNKEVMEILVDIFDIKKCYDNITLDAERYPKSFKNDFFKLWELIKNYRDKESEHQALWKEMSYYGAKVIWCLNYYWRYLSKYLEEKQR